MLPQKIDYFSSAGNYLSCNEDQVMYDLGLGVFGVLDGFGGVGIGDIAAKSAIDNFLRFFVNIVEDRDSTMPFDYLPQYNLEMNFMLNALYQINFLQNKKNKESGVYGGCSLALCHLGDGVLSFAGVGTCSAYIRPKRHNFSQLYIPDEVISHSGFSIPQNAIGLVERPQFYLRELKVASGDQLVLSTSSEGMLKVDELFTGEVSAEEFVNRINDSSVFCSNNTIMHIKL